MLPVVAQASLFLNTATSLIVATPLGCPSEFKAVLNESSSALRMYKRTLTAEDG